MTTNTARRFNETISGNSESLDEIQFNWKLMRTKTVPIGSAEFDELYERVAYFVCDNEPVPEHLLGMEKKLEFITIYRSYATWFHEQWLVWKC